MLLAALYYTAYMWVGSAVNMRHNVPPPIVIEHGEVYDYKEIESAIMVPDSYSGTCEDQQLFVLSMVMHYNNWRHIRKENLMTMKTMDMIASRWVCVPQ